MINVKSDGCKVNPEIQVSRMQNDLFSMRDEKYKTFVSKLIPNLPSDVIIGVRAPDMKKYSKGLSSDSAEFLYSLPHKYHEENCVHGFVIMEIKDFHQCVDEIERFLPFVDNWAVCDSLRPKVFKYHKKELFPYVEKWMEESHPYTVRFGIQMLMIHFLDDAELNVYFEKVSAVKSEEYYVNMMIAWFFATAFSKSFEKTASFVENAYLDNRISKWIFCKTIQKACESNRLTKKQKETLRSLKNKLIGV